MRDLRKRRLVGASRKLVKHEELPELSFRSYRPQSRRILVRNQHTLLGDIPEPMRFKGTLKSWNDERGFGFLEPSQGGEDIFVHVKALRLRMGRPQVGQILSFEVELGPQGKKRAKNVELFRSPHLQHKAREAAVQSGIRTLSAIPLFLILYVVVSVLWGPPVVIAAIFVGASL